MKAIVNTYLDEDSSCFIEEGSEMLKHKIVYDVLSNDLVEMPWELRKLQRIVFEELCEPLRLYLQQDITTFRNTIVSDQYEEIMLLHKYCRVHSYKQILPSMCILSRKSH